MNNVLVPVESICEQISEIQFLPLEEQVAVINRIKECLHEVSPFKDEPVDCVLWVLASNVEANGYNPNTVAPPEMRLLETSIKADGYTQPVVAFEDAQGNYTVVDGYHRTRVCKESKAVRARVHGYLPVTVIRASQQGIKDRMAATIRHNRARGVHGVEPMIDIVRNLLKEGWADDDVSKQLGMDADEVLRLKQHTGLAELFKDGQYSRAWE